MARKARLLARATPNIPAFSRPARVSVSTASRYLPTRYWATPRVLTYPPWFGWILSADSANRGDARMRGHCRPEFERPANWRRST